jgi:hypothetical protein
MSPPSPTARPHHSSLSLLQNSALIARWAALRAAARGAPPSALLYGPSLEVASAGPNEAGGGEGEGKLVVSGGDDYYRSVSQLELRLSNGIGIEVRSACGLGSNSWVQENGYDEARQLS